MTSAPDNGGSAARAASPRGKQTRAPLKSAVAAKTILVGAEIFMVQRTTIRIAGDHEGTIATAEGWPGKQSPTMAASGAAPGASPPSPFADALFFRVDDLNPTVHGCKRIRFIL